IEMSNTGVILKALQQVNANGSISLEIDQEISNVVNPDQQTLTPTISQRRVHSSVAVASGQTVLLAGLISERYQQSNAGIPGSRASSSWATCWAISAPPSSARRSSSSSGPG